MIKSVLLCLIFISQIVFANSSRTASSILLLGDSLSASYGMKESEGWVHQLNQQLMTEKRSYQIINASISGETTAGGLARLPEIMQNEAIDYLLIELGANDGLRGFPPTLIKNNLLKIIALAHAKKINVILMQIKIPPNYGPRYSQMFEGIYAEIVASEKNITLLPFFMEDIATRGVETSGQSDLMLADGLHPNQKAQPLIAQQLKEQLNAILSND